MSSRFTSPPPGHQGYLQPAGCIFFFVCWCLGVLAVQSPGAQIESVEVPRTQFFWVSHGRLEGHLARNYSPSGAFSPDSSTLAVANQDKVVLMNLKSRDILKVLNPRLERVAEFEIESANFLSPDQVFVLGSGLVQTRAKSPAPRTPELAFRWDTDKDALVGKVHGVGTGGGFAPARWFPDIGYLGLGKENFFELWNPSSGTGGRIVVPPLTRPAHLFAFSPDGHWLLLAQIEGSSKADPVVVERRDNQFVNILPGHTGTVLSLAFSRDGTKVVTACEDSKVRIYSVPDWNLVRALEGHAGPAHWAEFSANGQWVASAGEDKTVRIWSAETGQLVQTLRESPQPVLTVAFSPSDEFVAASTEKNVLVWQRRAGGR